MRLTHLANQTIIVSRLMTVSGSKLALATVTGVSATVQPVGLEKTIRFGGVPGALYKIFVDSGTDIQEGDQLRDENDNIYTVRKGGVTSWQQGNIDYIELYVTKG